MGLRVRPGLLRQHFKAAVEKGSIDPETFAVYGQLLSSSGAAPTEIIAVMRRVTELAPDSIDAWLNLGVTQARAREYESALETLAHIQKVTPERAFALFYEQAYCYARLNEIEQARAFLVRAKPYASTPQQKQDAAQLATALDVVADHTNPEVPRR